MLPIEYLALNPTWVELLSDRNLKYITSPEDNWLLGKEVPQNLEIIGAFESAPSRNSR